MERKPESLAERDVTNELKASIAARRELGDEMEDHVLEAFLARVQQRIDAQVSQQLAQHKARLDKQEGRSRGGAAPWVVPAALFAAVPLVAVASQRAHGFGVLVVMIAVVGILALYWEFSQR